MKLVTADEMRGIDEVTTRQFGVPSILLMEVAGKRVADEVWRLGGTLPRGKRLRVAVVSGGGANGGDGFCAARHLANANAEVNVYLVASETKVVKDSRVEFDALKKIGTPIVAVADGDLTPHDAWLRGADVVVDAIFGTGLKTEVVGGHRKSIELLNALPAKRLAVDVPSGLDADIGQPFGAAVRADVTVTMGLPKRGLFLYPGADYAGDVIVADIGIPRSLLESDDIKVNVLTEAATRTKGRTATCLSSPGRSGRRAQRSCAATRRCGRARGW